MIDPSRYADRPRDDHGPRPKPGGDGRAGADPGRQADHDRHHHRDHDHDHDHERDRDRDLEPMRRAIAASREAMLAGDRPFGAALVTADGRLLRVARNLEFTLGDPTAHAETMLVREVCASEGAEPLRGGTVYASGEPCAMCAGAMFWAGIRRIVYAAPTAVMAEVLADVTGPDRLPIGCAATLDGARPPVDVDGPWLADEAIVVLREAAIRGD